MTPEVDVEDIISRGDRVDFRAYFKTATPAQACLAWIKASKAHIPDMADAAEAKMREDTSSRPPSGP